MFYPSADMGISVRLIGAEIHGFYTLQDLDVITTLEEARTRWLRPNEIHAMLCNYKYFTINVKPINLPKSGSVLMFDRKMLRHFRKDGHNWKKKKDGKTVKEAHEHLKVGNEERIHVYYAHGQDNPSFVRRCYWLLDKALEHIVLVHYRETQEIVDSPSTPMYSNSSSISDHSNAWTMSEELDASTGNAPFSGVKQPESGESLKIMNHQMRLHEINTLEWDELVASDLNTSSELKGAMLSLSNQPNRVNPAGGDMGLSTRLLLNNSFEDINKKAFNSQPGDPLDFLGNEGLQSQDSFGKWIDFALSDSSAVSYGVGIYAPPGQGDFALLEGNEFVGPEPVFAITDVSPSWGFATESTKILITGYFPEQYQSGSQAFMYCISGSMSFPLEVVQPGVYRCFLSSDSPGEINLCTSFDRRRPISKHVTFEFREKPALPQADDGGDTQWEEFLIQIRLLKLLLPISKNLSALVGETPECVTNAKKFTKRISPYANSWAQALTENFTSKLPVDRAKGQLFEFTLKNLIKDWLLEKVLEGCQAPELDQYGQGVLHLCAILGYTWAVQLFKLSKLSLDFRDKSGWTALHWASYCGKEKMVGTLLSFGSNANRVTDPTPENPGGCTAADLAYSKGFDGLAAYLSEKALVTHFNEMTIAGNVTGNLQPHESVTDILDQEDYELKDSLAAYHTAADAASRIQTALREHSLKVRTKAVEFENPEEEARGIVAAMKIQNAYRTFGIRKKIAAAARIQYRFRTWKMRREFLNLRSHTIKIQAAFRAFQARVHYKKIVWSVGVLEKAILRWRLKRKGFRGLQVDEQIAEQNDESDAEENFYKNSRKLAEERVERSVVRVQAMFRSKKAQAEYQRMKLAHNEARLEYNEFRESDDEADMKTG